VICCGNKIADEPSDQDFWIFLDGESGISREVGMCLLNQLPK
jgi:hypothetical protein